VPRPGRSARSIGKGNDGVVDRAARVKRDREMKQVVGIGQVIERMSRSLKVEMGLISHRRRSQGRNGGTKEKAMVSRRAAPDP